jgi:hypothetical protein
MSTSSTNPLTPMTFKKFTVSCLPILGVDEESSDDKGVKEGDGVVIKAKLVHGVTHGKSMLFDNVDGGELWCSLNEAVCRVVNVNERGCTARELGADLRGCGERGAADAPAPMTSYFSRGRGRVVGGGRDKWFSDLATFSGLSQFFTMAEKLDFGTF